MFRFSRKAKGVVLLLLLGTILIVMTLAGVASYLILNQSRVGQHQINRIKAYYAALAGINLALEKLRVGNWTIVQPYALCRNNVTCNDVCVDCFEEDLDIPYRVNITISAPNPTTGIRTVNATTDYTYTP